MYVLLASQSPRRRELIGLLGLPHQTLAAHADEESIQDPDPATNVVNTAELKAAVVLRAARHRPDLDQAILVAADTTVALNGAMLNKPVDAAAARSMLQQLCGRSHQVHTGYVIQVVGSGQRLTGVSSATVTMRAYADDELNAYVASGDPYDKAGAYAIQHPIFKPVAQLAGCYLTVVGLPVCDLLASWRRLGLPYQADYEALRHAHDNFACPTLARLLE